MNSLQQQNLDDPWAALFLGILEVLIRNQKVDAINQIINSSTTSQFLSIYEVKALNVLYDLRKQPLLSKISDISMEGARGLMRHYILSQYAIMVPPICNQLILKKLSMDFNMNISFITPNLQLKISSSENLPEFLTIVQTNGVYEVQIQQVINTNYTLPMVQACTGCLGMKELKHLNYSQACHHLYCNICLKVQFKMGMQFKCRDFFCPQYLTRDDFPLFQMSPLQVQQQSPNRCSKCYCNSNTLLANKCGHQYCTQCIEKRLKFAQRFSTVFCLDSTCTELLDQALINSYITQNQEQSNEFATTCVLCNLPHSNSEIRKPLANCQHYYCKQCLKSAYQRVISYGLNDTMTCPKCNGQIDISKFYDSFYTPEQTITITRTTRAISESTIVDQPQSQTPLQRLQRRQNPLTRSDVREKQFIPAETPRRGMPQTFSSYIHQGAFDQQRKPQFY